MIDTTIGRRRCLVGYSYSRKRDENQLSEHIAAIKNAFLEFHLVVVRNHT
jgi:hypothetical protein